MTKEIWIVKGSPITQEQIDDDCYPQTSLGKTEWQFSNGPCGLRSESEDFDDIEDGLRTYSGHTIYFDEFCTEEPDQ